MGIKSINEPDGPGRTTMIHPMSINEPVEIPSQEDLTPVITALDPVACDIGDTDFTLYVSGENFRAESVIFFAGHDEPTTLEDDGTLSTGVKPSLWEAAVVVECQVHNGPLMSNAVDFSFDAPVSQTKRTAPRGKRTRRDGSY
jgi:phage terminase large subunit-like protein